jgi:hypothetical protein
LAEVDHFIVAIDGWFPNSQPRVFAPAAGSDYRWPHVESGGLLCLRPSRCGADVVDRILCHLADAEVLLNYSPGQCREEFQREFIAYWGQRATKDAGRIEVQSLLTPSGETREVVYYHDVRHARFVVADGVDELKRWLRNVGLNPGDKQLFPTCLVRLPEPLLPSEFPQSGAEVTRLLPPELLRRCLFPGRSLPIVFEAQTVTGATFVSVVLKGGDPKALIKGFRNAALVPLERIVNSFGRPLQRLPVTRVDGAWVHGRDHPSDYTAVKGRSVAIVGCGAIGAALAMLLAKAGVGELLLIDGDELTVANISRHPLGLGSVGLNKATALAATLRRQLPHLTFEGLSSRFEGLSQRQLSKLSNMDMIVAAGIDFDGETALDSWRRSLPRPPAYLSTWTEAYAVAGHAVLLYGAESILAGFDADERPTFRLTDWPDDAGALHVEAGCGNVFQPHGVIYLQPIIAMAGALALDALQDKVLKSCRRAWLGDPSTVMARAGKVREAFDAAMTRREFTWP